MIVTRKERAAAPGFWKRPGSLVRGNAPSQDGRLRIRNPSAERQSSAQNLHCPAIFEADRGVRFETEQVDETQADAVPGEHPGREKSNHKVAVAAE